MIIAPVEAIAELLSSEGARDYLGEPVTVAAALLHDVGHLRGTEQAPGTWRSVAASASRF